MDWRYGKYRNQFPEDEEQAKALLTQTFTDFPYWAELANLLADAACEQMDNAEKKAMWHGSYGRSDRQAKFLEDMPFYEAVHRLAHLIHHVDMLGSARGIAEAIIARHAKPGDRSRPIDIPPKGKPPKKR